MDAVESFIGIRNDNLDSIHLIYRQLREIEIDKKTMY